MRVETTDPAIASAALEVVSEVALTAEGEIRLLLPALADDTVLSVRIGTSVIPETGEVGASVAPQRVEWTVDPGHPGGVEGIARRELRYTLFHELHHQVRGWLMTGGDPMDTFMDGVVAEGLATAFERDAAGRRPPWGEYPTEVESWVEELRALPVTADYPTWMFQHPDGRRWIGYRAGTYVADRAITNSGRSAAELVTTPSADVLRAAFD